ncbi:hypothetical protein D3C73_1088090 [compost metagenome]
MLEQMTFDFSQLNSIPSNFDLLVASSFVLHITGRQQSGDIACFVHFALGNKRIVNKFFSAKCFIIQVTQCNTGTGNIHFPISSKGHRAKIGVQQIDLSVVSRYSNRNGTSNVLLWVILMNHAPYNCFSWPVLIINTHCAIECTGYARGKPGF